MKYILPVSIVAILLLMISRPVNTSEKQLSSDTLSPPFLYNNSYWADSVFNSLTLDERIAQLFIIQAYSNKDAKYIEQIAEQIKQYKVGGVIFFQGGPYRQAMQTNYYQSISKTPLLVAIDAEWGLSMRLDSTMTFPKQLTLGGIRDNSLVYEMGAEIARQCKRIGIHINFAPVVDINSNPKNPVIGIRSFGEDRHNVAEKGVAYMLGMQDNHVLAVAKHFPGHGDTKTDSHKTLPIIYSSKKQLDSVELFPFRQLIYRGLGGVMVAHLSIPALDTTPNLPSSLSKKIVTGLLKGELQFKGISFTDALGMAGVGKYFQPGDADLKAILAGNDVLLMSRNVPGAIKLIKQAIADGLITEEEINERCRKVLALKKWVDLDDFKPIRLDSIYEDLNTEAAKGLKRKLEKASVGMIYDKEHLFPFNRLDTLKLAAFTIGSSTTDEFQRTISNYVPVDFYGLATDAYPTMYKAALEPLKKYNTVIVCINQDEASLSSELPAPAFQLLAQLSQHTRIILCLAGNLYQLDKFTDLDGIIAVITAGSGEASLSYLAQAMFGGIACNARLPVAVGNFKQNTGLEMQKIRLGYCSPDELGLDGRKFTYIDTFVNQAINEHAIPGCQVLIAKNGMVCYQRSFGNHTYDENKPVTNLDLYDLASVTKTMATTVALMKLVDEGKLDVKKKLSFYLPELLTTNKKKITVEDVMTHHARLIAGLPFVYYAMRRNDAGRMVLNDAYFSTQYSDSFSRKVADNLYITSSFSVTMFNSIYTSKLADEKGFLYSDLGFMMLQLVAERLSGMPLDKYVTGNFYAPMGATSLGYLPLERFDRSQIVPTALETTFRRQLIQGYVHDEGAALLGGVAGHAGLFGNANDLAKMVQMLLDGGVYVGKRFLTAETIQQFTDCYDCDKLFAKNRGYRGLGFAKPDQSDKNLMKWLPVDSYGHTGFTGTFYWADPVNQIVYIFLSNRINPDRDNRKLYDMGTRRSIHKLIYSAMK